ncbi:MAG: 50S ribosomal protein L25, partial [Dysgonamonadaceae bacterium]|nr:50S ribosomal protein L25 [Dysgonamonadaceae bacterium]
MKTFELKGSLRDGLGKKATKAYRENNLVPCVLYGGTEVKHFNVTADGIRKLVYTPEVYMVNLELDGKKIIAILKDLQFHPVSDQLLHADFIQVAENKPITMEIPVVLEG